jgi:uncharacterized UBP type Zn finger protein
MAQKDKTAAWKHIQKNECPHLAVLGNKLPSMKSACEACGHTEHLRLCLVCGHVGCCESHEAHNTEHFRQTKHPLITPYRTDYDWLWCYECNAFLE